MSQEMGALFKICTWGKEGNAVYFLIMFKIIHVGRYDLRTKLKDGQLETRMQWSVVVMKSCLVFTMSAYTGQARCFPTWCNPVRGNTNIASPHKKVEPTSNYIIALGTTSPLKSHFRNWKTRYLTIVTYVKTQPCCPFGVGCAKVEPCVLRYYHRNLIFVTYYVAQWCDQWSKTVITEFRHLYF